MYFIGVDIGGTKIAAGVVDSQGTVLLQRRAATPVSECGDGILNASVTLAREVLDSFGEKVTAIGIGAGGQIDSDSGVVVSATALLPGWAGQAVAARFREEFSTPAFVDNDVNAFALGEARFGAARGKDNAAFLALGTGTGGALMLNGQLVHGAHWSAGEIGHIIVNMDQNARVDSGGHKGTLEAYVSGHGLVATWREITGDRSEITGDAIAVEAKQDLGGPAALAITQTGQYLGIGLVSILSILDPEIVVIGGGLASLGEQLLAPARNVVKARALFGAADCPIVVAELGSSSSIVGAAAVALGKL